MSGLMLTLFFYFSIGYYFGPAPWISVIFQSNAAAHSSPNKWSTKEFAFDERTQGFFPLHQVARGTTISKARAAMEKAGFECSYGFDQFGKSYLLCRKDSPAGNGLRSAIFPSDSIEVMILHEGGLVTGFVSQR